MEKFHYFLYGKEFTLKTDQKPLVSIYKKHMIDISPRVQRLIVRSVPYLPFKVVYKKGTDIPVADALSHVTPMDPEENTGFPLFCTHKIPGIIFFFFNVASTYNWVSVYTLYVLLLHCFVYTTQKYAYLPLQLPIMTCITLKGGS